MVWVLVLYHIAGSYAGEKAWGILKNYIPVCKMALRTHSSQLWKNIHRKQLTNVCRLIPSLSKRQFLFLPRFITVVLCLQRYSSLWMISRILYGSVPAPGTMVIFSILLATCSIGTPGLPWGTVMVSLGTLTGILKFGDSGQALMFAVFALNDAFAAACNATCDGAAALFLTGYVKRHDL